MHPLATPAAPPLLIGLPADRVADDDGMVFDRIGHQYLQALAAAVAVLGAVGPVVPLLLPTTADDAQLDALLPLLDGVLLTGSPSNVEPVRYGQTAGPRDGPFDAARDALTHRVVPHALAQGLPLLAVCRGLQEANVALGGTLRRELHRQPGMQDHREPPDVPVEAAFAPRHRVRLRADGVLAGWAQADEAVVNSLHHQGIDRLADGARAEAWADDGLVEAFTWPGSPGFFTAVQWHPEAALALDIADAPVLDTRLFESFVRAALAHRSRRTGAAAAAAPAPAAAGPGGAAPSAAPGRVPAPTP